MINIPCAIWLLLMKLIVYYLSSHQNLCEIVDFKCAMNTVVTSWSYLGKEFETGEAKKEMTRIWYRDIDNTDIKELKSDKIMYSDIETSRVQCCLHICELWCDKESWVAKSIGFGM